MPVDRYSPNGGYFVQLAETSGRGSAKPLSSSTSHAAISLERCEWLLSLGDTNTIEIIAGARRLTVPQEEARNNPDVLILVELREMDDAEACALVAAENEGRRAFVPLETAHFYKEALTTKIYKDQAALADALSLNKSNVGRTLTILDLP